MTTVPTAGEAIPSGWELVSLGDLCERMGGSVQTGPFGSQLHAEDYKDDGIPIITVEHLGDGEIVHRNLPLVGPEDAQRLSRYTLKAGDLVFSRVGAIDRCALVTTKENGWLFSGRCLRVRTSGVDVVPGFLSGTLNHQIARRWIINHAVGSTMACLNTKILSGVPIQVPPPIEQVRIAEMLDTLDEAIRRTDRILEKLEKTRQGLLLESFEARVMSKAVPLSYYLQTIEAGKSPNCPEMPAMAGEWGVLKVSAVVISGFRAYENKSVSNPAHFNPAYEVHRGDLLITRANTYELVAQACVICDTPPHLMLCDKTLRLKPNARASAKYLCIALTTPTARRHIEINATGSSGTMKNITQGAIRSIPVPDLDREAQDLLTQQMEAISSRIRAENEGLDKLKSLKFGLSSDLLSGRVRTHPR